MWLATAESCRGWLLAKQGQAEEGIAQIRQGLTAYRATGAQVHWYIQPLIALAEVCLKVGRTEEGLSALTEAMYAMNSHDERWLEAELYRLKGELLLTQESKEHRAQSSEQRFETPNPNTPGEAEACFLKAIEVAQRQQAKSLELRATVSLARLWQKQGKQNEAHRRLSEIYNWFTEGFDTKDLQEAKALIEELSP